MARFVESPGFQILSCAAVNVACFQAGLGTMPSASSTKSISVALPSPKLNASFGRRSDFVSLSRLPSS